MTDIIDTKVIKYYVPIDVTRFFWSVDPQKKLVSVYCTWKQITTKVDGTIETLDLLEYTFAEPED
jgi:hypothetical protein